MLQLLAIFDDVNTLSRLENRNSSSPIGDLSFYEDLSDPAVINALLERIQENYRREKETSAQTAAPQSDRPQEDAVHIFAVPKIYNCMYCPRRFYNKLACRSHQIDHVKKQLQCTYCGRRMHNTAALRRHFEYFHYYVKPYVLVDRSF